MSIVCQRFAEKNIQNYFIYLNYAGIKFFLIKSVNSEVFLGKVGSNVIGAKCYDEGVLCITVNLYCNKAVNDDHF